MIMSNKNGKSLVSICVITYNSKATVVDTLESILSQSYGSGSIELIISDDCSNDSTSDIISSWLENNAAKFANVIFHQSAMNLGITKNCNAAWRLSSGEWIKTIAGDDILLNTCISDNITFAQNYSIDSVIFSKMQVFKVDVNNKQLDLNILPSKFQQKVLCGSCEEQLHYLRNAEGLSVAPSVFIYRDLLVSVGYGDERFSMIEDYPLWIRILESGKKCYFLNKLTVKYRTSESASRSMDLIFNMRHLMQRLNIDLELNKDKIGFFAKIRKTISYSLLLFICYFFGAKKNKASYCFYTIAMIVKPYWLRQKIYNIFSNE